MIFLVINVFLAIFIAGNYLFKSKIQEIKTENQVVVSKNDVVIDNPQPASEIPPIVTTAQEVVPPVVVPQETIPAPVCITIGPINTEKKGMMDFILNRYKQSDLAKVERKKLFQIYWYLGSDKEEAEKLFNKQKENAMSEDKYVLLKSDNDWIVNIVKVNGQEAVADKLTTDLAVKAKKINTGGSWKFKALPEGYFYTFPDFKKLNEDTINQIETLLSPIKEPC